MAKTASVLQILESDVKKWLNNNRKIITNERDLQVKLTMELEASGNYNEVYTEYAVKTQILTNRGIIIPSNNSDKSQYIGFPWHNDEISLDIVVRLSDKYAILELKYFTRPIIFGCHLFGEEPIESLLKEKAAIDVVSYDYCKDIRRIEVMKSAFNNVEGGIALLIANNHNLWDESHRNVLYAPFSLHEDNHFLKGLHAWPNYGSMKFKNDRPPFITDCDYKWHWENTAMPFKAANAKNEIFRYLLTVVDGANHTC